MDTIRPCANPDQRLNAAPDLADRFTTQFGEIWAIAIDTV